MFHWSSKTARSSSDRPSISAPAEEPFADQRNIVDLIPLPAVGATDIRYIVLLAPFEYPGDMIDDDRPVDDRVERNFFHLLVLDDRLPR